MTTWNQEVDNHSETLLFLLRGEPSLVTHVIEPRHHRNPTDEERQAHAPRGPNELARRPRATNSVVVPPATDEKKVHSTAQGTSLLFVNCLWKTKSTDLTYISFQGEGETAVKVCITDSLRCGHHSFKCVNGKITMNYSTPETLRWLPIKSCHFGHVKA